MCGDNMLEDDVKKTSENGGENGMIEGQLSSRSCK